MSASVHSHASDPQEGRLFATTHWSVVLGAADARAPGAQEALEKLCRTYWYPLYAYVRRQGHSPEDAQDLTQEFFKRLLEKEYLRLADRQRGHFRTFLLESLKNFLRNEWRDATRVKRGGGRQILSLDAQVAEIRYTLEPRDEASPEKLYEKRWAAMLLQQTLDLLRQEFCTDGRERLFEELKVFVWGEKSADTQAQVAARLGLTEAAVNVAVHRLRRRYRELLREAIAHTVANPAEIDEELRYLKTVLRG